MPPLALRARLPVAAIPLQVKFAAVIDAAWVSGAPTAGAATLAAVAVVAADTGAATP